MRLFWIVAIIAMASACSLTPTAADDVPPDASVPRPPFTTGASTLAGWAPSGDVDGPREVNLFANPVGVAAAADGHVFVADFDNHKIRIIDASGTASTVFSQPGFERPFAMAPSGGALYVVTDNDPNRGHDAMSGTIWKLDLAAETATVVAARIGRPRGIAVLADGRLAVADYMHHVVEIVDPATGAVRVLAGAWDAIGAADGQGSSARFSTPYGLVVRGDGSLIVADHENHHLRAISADGTVSTLPGELDRPQALAITAAGDLYVSDTGSSQIFRYRDQALELIAGDGTAGYLDADDLLASRFHGLEGVAVAPDGGRVYVADGTRGEALPFNRIRLITPRSSTTRR